MAFYRFSHNRLIRGKKARQLKKASAGDIKNFLFSSNLCYIRVTPVTLG